MTNVEDTDGWLNRQQGFFGEKTIGALAAAGGLSCSKPELDLGYDLNLEAADGEVARLQIKTTRIPLPIQDNCLRYPLEVEAYDRLRRVLTVPSFLILMEVRPRRQEWVACMEWGFILRRQARYVSLQGLPTSNNVATVTVSLPLVNMVTPDVLRRMAGGGPL
jgi:Domain of unknown function (DUF4365)